MDTSKNLNPKILNPNARDLGIKTKRYNVTIKPENREMASQIGGGNASAGIDKSIEASQALSRFKQKLRSVDTETLKTLEFAIASLPEMPHQILGSDLVDQKAIDADVLRWTIQRGLDSRKAGELPYTWEEMYLAMKIPKEFLS
jgi:hypothetical protein